MALNRDLLYEWGKTYCWLRFCCWTCWICWGAGLLRDGSITPGITGRDTGLLPYPGGPMAGPCGVMRLDGGMPGLCIENTGTMIFTPIKFLRGDFLGISFLFHKSLHSHQVCSIELLDHRHWGFANVKLCIFIPRFDYSNLFSAPQYYMCFVYKIARCARLANLDSGFPLYSSLNRFTKKGISNYCDNRLIV